MHAPTPIGRPRAVCPDTQIIYYQNVFSNYDNLIRAEGLTLYDLFSFRTLSLSQSPLVLFYFLNFVFNYRRRKIQVFLLKF